LDWVNLDYYGGELDKGKFEN